MTAAFLDRLRVEQVGWLGGRALWMTLAPLRYQSALHAPLLTVAPEFVTDLASVPRLLLSWFIAGGRAPRAAVLHDWLCQHPEWTDTALRDAIFREAMAADPMSGTNAVTRALMWAGVRAYSVRPWRSDGRAAELNPEWSATAWPTIESP